MNRIIVKRVSALFALAVILFSILPAAASRPDTAVIQAGSLPNPDLFIDVDWYRQQLIKTVDLWNGGLDGESGMGVYRDDFDGLFHVELTQDWQQKPMPFSSSVAQSRGIYINVEAYRAAGAENGQRFLRAIDLGVQKLMDYFHDPEYGGFYWMVSPTGRIIDAQKHGYGNVHPLFALAQAYSVTGNLDYLNDALLQLAIVQQYFLDRNYPGGIHGSMTRNFSSVIAGNSIDPFTHYFEALLILFDVTGGEQQAHIADMITEAGNFLTQHLYRDQDGFTDRGYVAYNYDAAWNPSQIPYTRPGQWVDAMHASTGHNIELAYLLSRAVERGFPAQWLEVSEKLIKFCREYAIDAQTGGMIYEITDYAGQPIPDNPDNEQYIWWPQAETARASLHFSVVRGDDLQNAFKSVESFINAYLTDPEYGGWYQGVQRGNLEPLGLDKGSVWKVGYHYSMLFGEVVRLGQAYPDQIAALNAAYAAAH